MSFLMKEQKKEDLVILGGVFLQVWFQEKKTK